VCKELDKLCNTPLTESALRHALAQLRGQLAISAQNQENSALAMAKSMLYRGISPSWQETMEKIDHISTMQLQKVAKELLSTDYTYILTYE
jgi:predicted Zn-dependent peptidase